MFAHKKAFGARCKQLLCTNFASDVHVASEGAFLVDVSAFDGFLGGLEVETDIFEVPHTAGGLLGQQLLAVQDLNRLVGAHFPTQIDILVHSCCCIPAFEHMILHSNTAVIGCLRVCLVVSHYISRPTNIDNVGTYHNFHFHYR